MTEEVNSNNIEIAPPGPIVHDAMLGFEDLIKLGVFNGQVNEQLYNPPGGVKDAKLFEVSFSEACRCNVSDEDILKQVDANIRRGLPQVRPYAINPHTAVLVCGGPSLEMAKQELIETCWRKDCKIFTVNGAFEWCIKNNIKPGAVMMIDAREFNARFVEKEVPDCKYLLAAQCHPKAFDICRGRDIFIWHALSACDAEVELLKEFYHGHFWPISHGTTIGVRAISLLQMLGFYSIEIFGLDSCWFDSRHHAYPQDENQADGDIITWLKPEGRPDLARSFVCSPWMMKQAMDFQQLLLDKSELFRLNVHGPGLIAEILRTGAQLEPPSTGLTSDFP